MRVSTSFRDDTTFSALCNTDFIIARTYTISDACGNKESCTQNISVFTPIPEIVCPVDTTIDCGTDTSLVSLGRPVATGACKNNAIITTITERQYPGGIATYGYGISSSDYPGITWSGST